MVISGLKFTSSKRKESTMRNLQVKALLRFKDKIWTTYSAWQMCRREVRQCLKEILIVWKKEVKAKMKMNSKTKEVKKNINKIRI